MSEQDDERAQALSLWQEGYRLQMAGDLDAAITAYQRSLTVRPTAEAHTFLGWAMSFQGRLAEAIEECHRAIAVDPEFGNPYNDIGVYLMQQDKLDEAIPWLERAKAASRYEPRHFPYMNLGRVYAKQGKWSEAFRELEAAVRVAPRDAGARHALHELRGKFN
jgi:tetratricopeptide (TPR) repeat protein